MGADRAPSDLVFVKCRDRNIAGAERATLLAHFFFFSSFFFFYIMYSLLRYKNSHTALAMA